MHGSKLILQCPILMLLNISLNTLMAFAEMVYGTLLTPIYVVGFLILIDRKHRE